MDGWRYVVGQITGLLVGVAMLVVASAAESLEVHLAGSGSVDCPGEPTELNQHVAGTGKVNTTATG